MKPALVTAALVLVCMSGNGTAAESHVTRCRLKVRVEPALHRLEGEAFIQHPPSSRFHLYRGFAVRQVEADGKAVPFHAEPSAAPLAFSRSATAVVVNARNIRELHIKYSGEMSEVIAGVNLIGPDLVELALYAAWYPLFPELNQYEFDLEANLPQAYVTIVNAELRSRRTDEGRVITAWTSYGTGYDILLLASPLLHPIKGAAGSTRVEIYYYRLPEQVLKSEAEGLAAGMGQFASMYGPLRANRVLRLVYSPRGGWGYSRIPLIVVSEERAMWVLGRENGEAKDFRNNAHEAAHFWWSISDSSTANDWINEGLAEFSAFRITEERFGTAFAEERVAEYKRNASQNKTSDCIAETEQASPDRQINRYDKATLMFLEAQRRFGKEPLDRFLRALHARFAGAGRATTALFLEEAEKQMGEEAQAYFCEELYPKSGSWGRPTGLAVA